MGARQVRIVCHVPASLRPIIAAVPHAARPSGFPHRLSLPEEGPSALRMTWTDEELVARSIGGDADSFNELIHRWERPIYALAYRQIGREEDARDVCQETFLRAFRALKGFRGQAKFSSWLYRIALNLCRDWMRRERRTPVVQGLEDSDLMDLAASREPSESIEDRVARHDLTRAVERTMALLPEEQRTAIVLKEYHGLTFQEIADLVGCPLSTVKTRLYQGLAVLRRELARAGTSAAAR
jgi:RNA polymerase sigma-70 factor, ECF subfamily